jgi:hypothetical protein
MKKPYIKNFWLTFFCIICAYQPHANAQSEELWKFMEFLRYGEQYIVSPENYQQTRIQSYTAKRKHISTNKNGDTVVNHSEYYVVFDSIGRISKMENHYIKRSVVYLFQYGSKTCKDSNYWHDSDCIDPLYYQGFPNLSCASMIIKWMRNNRPIETVVWENLTFTRKTTRLFRLPVSLKRARRLEPLYMQSSTFPYPITRFHAGVLLCDAKLWKSIDSKSIGISTDEVNHPTTIDTTLHYTLTDCKNPQWNVRFKVTFDWPYFTITESRRDYVYEVRMHFDGRPIQLIYSIPGYDEEVFRTTFDYDVRGNLIKKRKESATTVIETVYNINYLAKD